MKTMTFAFAGLIAMVAGTSVQATDLTTNSQTNPRAIGRYMANIGRPGGKTALWWTGIPCGVIEFVTCPHGDTWQINDGNPNTFFDTYGYGGTPDFFGYRFKIRAAKVTSLYWANQTFGDGGTFAAQPDVQYITDPHGPWLSVPAAEVTFNPPYNTAYDGGLHEYTIQLANPLISAWGVRLVGACNPGTSGDTNGFLGIGEFTVYGDLDIGDLDLSRNLALGGTGLANSAHYPLTALTDGSQDTSTDTWYNDRSDGSDAYLGVMFAAKKFKVRAIGIDFHRFGDGGMFADTTGTPLRVEYTADAGVTWQNVPNLDKGRYTDMWRRLAQMTNWDVGGGQVLAAETAFLFQFDELNAIDGLRVIGDTTGATWGAPYGFVGAYEVEVFGAALVSQIVNYDNSLDGDVDATDLGLFLSCFSGPAVPASLDPDCRNRDLDRDGDVDQADFAIFQKCFSGSFLAPDPMCGENP